MNLPKIVLIDQVPPLVGRKINVDDTQHSYFAEVLLKRPNMPLLVYDMSTSELKTLEAAAGPLFEDFENAFNA